MTTARSILAAALQQKSATESCCMDQPATNGPKNVEHPGQPETHAAGTGTHGTVVGKNGVKKEAREGVVAWLCKTAGLAKTAARRPGRLDGDEALDKLARLHNTKKRKA